MSIGVYPYAVMHVPVEGAGMVHGLLGYALVRLVWLFTIKSAIPWAVNLTYHMRKLMPLRLRIQYITTVMLILKRWIAWQRLWT